MSIIMITAAAIIASALSITVRIVSARRAHGNSQFLKRHDGQHVGSQRDDRGV